MEQDEILWEVQELRRRVDRLTWTVGIMFGTLVGFQAAFGLLAIIR